MSKSSSVDHSVTCAWCNGRTSDPNEFDDAYLCRQCHLRARKRVYDRVVAMVHHDCGTPDMKMSPTIRKGPLKAKITRSSVPTDAARKAFRKAIDNGDIVDVGHAVTVSDDDEVLRYAYDRECDRDDPRKAALGPLYQALEDIDGGDDSAK